MFTIKRMPAFDAWIAAIKDGHTRFRLLRRLEKVQRGNLGNAEPVGAGVSELREQFGPGWRMYYVQRGRVVIVMLGGGKRTQKADIATAKRLAATLEDWTMKARKVKIADLPNFDMAEYLNDDAAIAEYLSIVLEENNPSAVIDALGTIARARGMTEMAKASGVTREALYRALRADAHPRFDTIQRVVAALGLRLTAVPA